MPDFVATKKMQRIIAGFDQNQVENQSEFDILGGLSVLWRPFSGLQRHYAL